MRRPSKSKIFAFTECCEAIKMKEERGDISFLLTTPYERHNQAHFHPGFRWPCWDRVRSGADGEDGPADEHERPDRRDALPHL